MLVHMGDWLHKHDALTANAEMLSAALMALNGQKDIGVSTKEMLDEAVSSLNGGSVLRAFWSHYANDVELYDAESRLLVNPPVGIQPNSQWVATLNTQPYLTGSYGQKHVNVLSLDGPTQIEDIVVFYGQLVVPDVGLLRLIAPGSTITMAMPSEIHHFWMSWIQLDFGLEPLLEAVTKQWSLKVVHKQTSSKSVTVEVLGVEP